MQADFREERNWKRTLAYEVAQSVMEWHRTLPEERIPLRGYYRAPVIEDIEEPIERGVPEGEQEEEPQDVDLSEAAQLVNLVTKELETNQEEQMTTMDVQYDEAVTKSPKDTAIEAPIQQEPELSMKVEDTEPNISSIPQDDKQQTLPDLTQPPDDVKNPVLFVLPEDAKNTDLIPQYEEIREPVLELDSLSLWVDPLELDLPDAQEIKAEESEGATVPSKSSSKRANWNTLFPDLPLYEMSSPPDNRKLTSREDEIQSKSIAISPYANSQPLLLGALQPAIQLQNGHWKTFDLTPVSAEEGQRPVPISSRSGSYLV
jgi:chromatin modification-related protein VID21